MRPIILITALLTFLAGCSDQQGPIPMGDGYALILRGSEPLLHAPGNLQLIYSQSNKSSLVWNYVVGDPKVTNGIALFNGGLSDSDSWKSSPATFIHSGRGPAVEITEPLTRLYCERLGASYDSFSNQITYIWPKFTNGVFYLTGELNRPPNDPTRWIVLILSTNEMEQLRLHVLKVGSKFQYRKAWYLKE